MKAAVLETIPGDVVVDDLTIDRPGANEIVIRTEACGLCHSDLHVMLGDLPGPVPAVLGHEACGVVEAVGADVTEFAPGDRVVTCLNAFCGTCRECRSGRSWLCVNRNAIRSRPADNPSLTRDSDGAPVTAMAGLGGFAEAMLVHRRAAVKITADIAADKAALLGCAVITGVGSVFNTAKVRAGSTVAVIGAGGIGCNIIQGAVLAGAERVIAVDLHPEKLALATTFGATHVVNAAETDAVGDVLELTKGGADYTFEAIGLEPTIQQAIGMLRVGQTAYMVGVPPVGAPVGIPAAAMVLSGRGVQGAFMGSNHFPTDIPMLADLYLQGRLKLDELVDEHIGLDGVNAGYERMKSGTAARSVIVF